MCAWNLFHNLVRSFRNYLSENLTLALYSNEFIVIQIDLTGVISVETDIWSLPADKRGNILDVSCRCFAMREENWSCRRKLRNFFESFTFSRIYGQNGLCLISRQGIFSILIFYHITVCTVIRVYIYLKNGSRKRRNGTLLSETFVRVFKNWFIYSFSSLDSACEISLSSCSNGAQT